MSLNPNIRDQAYQFFIEEARELLQVLEDGLLDLKQDHSTAKVHELMRAAHSIKGGAASVELEAIEALAHRLEDFFKALYSDSIEMDAELENLLLQSYDCLRNPLTQQIETGAYDREAALLSAEPVFSALELRLGDALKDADSYIPSATDLGVDIVASIFEVDVDRALEHLTAVLHSCDRDVEAELRSQLEVFAGFAELFNLPGFGEIVRTAEAALDNHSDRALEILKLTIADCTTARTLVLEGDRERGGEVSQELLALSGATVEADDSLEVRSLETREDLDLDDVFGEIPQAEAVETIDNLGSEDLDLDDVFGEIPQAETIEDVFGDEPQLETIEPTNTLDKSPAEFSRPVNIDAAVESIDEIFDRLPAIDDSSALFQFLESKSAPSQTAKTADTSTQPKAAVNLSVRVDLNRLEKMNKLIGELTVQRNSLALQNEQLQNSVGVLIKKFLRFYKVTGKLRDFSEQILFESQSDRTFTSQLLQPTTNEDSSQFDPLEMDRYNLLQSLVQEVLEEVAQLEENVDDVATFARQSDRTINVQGRMLDKMRDELRWARMLPLKQILQRFPRTLHDLSSKYQKSVELKLTGTEVLVDKAVLEKLYEPILHLLRNGFDHGIEPPEIRLQQGKPETGTIEIHAYYRGDRTIIDIKDDGKGLDVEKITQKGIEQRLITAERAKNASKEEIFALIFEAGFSTANRVSELSGRGVGMNVVRSQIETLKGKIEVSSTPGKGTTFSLRLPLTLTIAKLTICSLGATAFAIASDSISDVIIPDLDRIKFANSQRFLLWNQSLIPVLPLSKMLPYNCTIPPTGLNSKVFETIDAPEDWALPLLLLQRGQKFFALEVESLVSERELAIEPFNKAIAAPSYMYGCSILSDGTLIPVFDGQTLIDVLIGNPNNGNTSNLEIEAKLDFDSVPSDRQVARSQTIAIIDDSTGLRRTMALSLSDRGYRVIQCKDGKHALEQLRQHPDIELIICDLEMPNMNGLEFLTMRRRDSELAKIPTIMLTSRSEAKHRNLALQLGANGYFTKPYIEREFLAEIDNILQTKNNNGNNSELTSKLDKELCFEPQLTVTPSNLNKKTILVVDDSASLRRTMASSLENNGYEVVQARDGREGLEILTTNSRIDLVICDVEMPNMNGFEFLSERRKNTELTKIPVAMLTSRNGEKHRHLAQQLGANAYFSKPYVEGLFLTEIEQIIKNN